MNNGTALYVSYSGMLPMYREYCYGAHANDSRKKRCKFLTWATARVQAVAPNRHTSPSPKGRRRRHAR